MAKKESRDAARYGTRNGEIKFGHVHNDQVLSAVMIRSGYDYRQYITMDADGKRKGTITSVTPNTYQIKCGHDTKRKGVAFLVEALNGDIVLNAKNGDVRIEGKNVMIVAKQSSGDNKNGVVSIEGNEKVDIRSKNIELNGSSVVKFFSAGSCELTAKSSMNFTAGLFAAVDNACSGGESKPCLWDSTPNDQVQSTDVVNG